MGFKHIRKFLEMEPPAVVEIIVFEQIVIAHFIHVTGHIEIEIVDSVANIAQLHLLLLAIDDDGGLDGVLVDIALPDFRRHAEGINTRGIFRNIQRRQIGQGSGAAPQQKRNCGE